MKGGLDGLFEYVQETWNKIDAAHGEKTCGLNARKLSSRHHKQRRLHQI